MSVQRFQHGSGATYVLESDYLATVADADLRYENGARNQRLIDEARIRELKVALREAQTQWWPGCAPIQSRSAALLTPSETACEHEWGQHKEWTDASGLHGSKRCTKCGRYVQW
jgi:hypothetical protein